MDVLEDFAEDTWRTGLLATAATTLAATALGEMESGNAIAPINAVSHILWGDRAANKDNLSLKYTVTGGLLNTAALLGWAGVHHLMFGRRSRASLSVSGALAGGAAISTLAYVTDYYLVPKRLTPGFEKRLSQQSLCAVYGALALALAAGSLMSRAATRN
jgi:hypothetical protein